MSGPTDRPSHLDQLLEPSLSDGTRATSIYSARAGFMVAFFGGGLASSIFGALNSRRLGRLGEDAWLYALGMLFFAGAAVAAGYAVAAGVDFATLGEDARRQGSALRILSRALGLGFFGLVFLRHRRFYKATELAGEDAPSPWLPGLGCIAAATLISLVLAGIGAVIGG
jgi:hypothetical protein